MDESAGTSSHGGDTSGETITKETAIGTANMLESAPTLITVSGERYIISRCGDGTPVLYAAVCPHQRGRVKIVDESTFRCPNHRWEFDAASGECVSGGDRCLDAYDVTVVDGEIRATIE